MYKKIIFPIVAIISVGYYLLFVFDREKTEFYDSGEKKKEYRTNINNEVEGILKEYYKNGNLKMISMLENGIQNGVTKRFYENGNVEFIIKLNDGILTDTSFFYRQNGTLFQKKIIESGLVIEYDIEGREIKRGFLKDQLLFTGYTINYLGNSKEWYQIVHYQNDSIEYILTKNDLIQLLHRDFRFTIELPKGSQNELIHDENVNFHMNSKTGNKEINILVVKNENRVDEILSSIKEGPVDSLFNDVVVNYEDDRSFISKMVFHHAKEDYYVDLIFFNYANTYWVSSWTSVENFIKDPQSLISVIESFTISEVEVLH